MRRFTYGNVYLTATTFEKLLPLYLTCVGGWEHQYPVSRTKGWPDFQWMQCVAGKGMVHMYDEVYELKEGQGMLLFPDEFHSYYPTTEPWSIRWISFNGKHAAEIVQSLQFGRSSLLNLSDPRPMISRMQEIKEMASLDSTKVLDCSGLLYLLLLDLCKYATRANASSPYESFSQLSPALRYIEEHACDPLSLQDIAAQLGLSNSHTCVLFRKTLGMRPFEFVNQIRTRKAAVMLQSDPSLSVAEAAKRVGFQSESYFIKIFKRTQFTTPNKFRALTLQH